MRFLVCALLVIATTNATKICTSGETRQDGPNTCLCSDDGLSWTCAPASRTCVPGTIFKYYCNECGCLEDGLAENAFCTRISCDRNKWNENGTLKYPEEDETSQQNEHYYHDNSEDDSTSNFYYPYPMHYSKKRGRCHAGKMFRNYCNFCICEIDETITGSSCTEIDCNLAIWNKDGTVKSNVPSLRIERDVETPKNDPEEKRCRTVEVFRDFCNICFCSTDKTIAGLRCTNMICDLAIWNKDGTVKSNVPLLRIERDVETPKNDPEEKRCRTVKVFRDFCNICFCSTDKTTAGLRCTNMICDLAIWNKDGTVKSNVPSLRIERDVETPKNDLEEERCRTVKVFRDFCNICFCSTDKTIAGLRCTNMICDLAIWNKDGTVKSNVPSLRIERDVENPKNDPEEKRCRTVKVFRDFCNICFCSTDKTTAGLRCTNMICDLAIWNKDGTVKSNVPSLRIERDVETPKNDLEEERCRTVEVFRDFCNICFCSTDKTIAGLRCTNRVCDLAIWNKDATKKSDVTLLKNERSVETPKKEIS